jgi:hypothetical protein
MKDLTKNENGKAKWKVYLMKNSEKSPNRHLQNSL